MEVISQLILKIYPLEGVSMKRRVSFHCIFWIIMFFSFWHGIGFPNASFSYKLTTATYFTILDIAFFYATSYVFLANKYSVSTVSILLVIGIPTFYLFICLISYIRVNIIIENNWLSATNNRLYNYINQYYKQGFVYFLRPSDVFSNVYEVVSTAMPAFLVKFSRTFAKHSTEKKQLEIDFLLIQLNPHFLINAINNIYSLVVRNDNKSPIALMSLSNLLRYVLYESSRKEVSIEDEVAFLKAYIKLQKISSTKKVKVNFEAKGDLNIKISPLIFISFIENAFKHGNQNSDLENYIKISITTMDKKINFEVSNTKNEISSTISSGIGVKNVKERLLSLYPNKHILIIKNEQNVHSVFLTITTK